MSRVKESYYAVTVTQYCNVAKIQRGWGADLKIASTLKFPYIICGTKSHTQTRKVALYRRAVSELNIDKI